MYFVSSKVRLRGSIQLEVNSASVGGERESCHLFRTQRGGLGETLQQRSRGRCRRLGCYEGVRRLGSFLHMIFTRARAFVGMQ